MKYALFTGCVAKGAGQENLVATNLACEKLGIELATSGPEACDSVVVRIRRKSDQYRRSLVFVHTAIVRDRNEMPIDGPVSRGVA